MKKVFFVVMISVMAIVGFVAFKILSESDTRLSPQALANYKSDQLDLKLSYSRPYKKGRKIFGGLLPYGEYWRTGADEATEIEFKNPVSFGGQNIDAGRYRLYTIPDRERWKVILNSELEQWGAFEPNYELDVAKVDANVVMLDSLVEQLTIDFESELGGANLVIKWDRTQVSVPIR